MSKISTTEFKSRLETLCLKGGGHGLPRKPHDQAILFKSITLTLDPQRDYTEAEINEALAKWLADIGQAVEIDHVSLRRYLVDAGYLRRDPGGRSYRIVAEDEANLFEPAVDELEPGVVIQEALARRAQRKQQYRQGSP